MGIYTEVDLGEINDILTHYEMGEALSFSPTTTGISNSNYKVSLASGVDVLLKISNDKTIPQLENEQEILVLLNQYKFKFGLAPLETLKGKVIYEHNGHFGVIFPFVKGLPPQINSNSCFQIGEALASLHGLKLEKEDLAKIRPHDLVGYGGITINEYINEPNSAPGFREAFLNIFPDELHNIPYELFPSGIIHGDLYYDNALFNNDKLVTLIDFEQAGRGRFILDIGIAISGSCLRADGSTVDLKLIESFILGYTSVRQMNEAEKEYLNAAILVGFFSIALWRIKRFYKGALDSAKRDNYKELLERARLFHHLITK